MVDPDLIILGSTGSAPVIHIVQGQFGVALTFIFAADIDTGRAGNIKFTNFEVAVNIEFCIGIGSVTAVIEAPGTVENAAGTGKVELASIVL